MVTDLVALCGHPGDDARVLLDVLADDIKGRFDISLFEHVQEAWGVGGMRAVVESHGNVGTWNTDRRVGNHRLLWSMLGRGWLGSSDLIQADFRYGLGGWLLLRGRRGQDYCRFRLGVGGC